MGFNIKIPLRGLNEGEKRYDGKGVSFCNILAFKDLKAEVL